MADGYLVILRWEARWTGGDGGHALPDWRPTSTSFLELTELAALTRADIELTRERPPYQRGHTATVYELREVPS